MKLNILKYMEKAYDSLYDLNAKSGYLKQYEDTLKAIELQAKEYGYKFKLNDTTQKFRLIKMTSQEWETYKQEVEQ